MFKVLEIREIFKTCNDFKKIKSNKYRNVVIAICENVDTKERKRFDFYSGCGIGGSYNLLASGDLFEIKESTTYCDGEVFIVDKRNVNTDEIKPLSIKVNFEWDNENDTLKCNLFVPKYITKNDLIKIFIEEHNYLCLDDEEDIYGTKGRTPSTLLDYICEKYNWQWDIINFDIDISVQ